MKRYIKSADTNQNEKEVISLRLDVEIVYAFEDGTSIAASILASDDAFINKKILSEVSLDYEAFVDSVVSIIQDNGFMTLDLPKKSPIGNSASTYYTFCLESDFVTASVEVFCYMRVSNHELPVHGDGTSPKTNQNNYYSTHLTDEYNWVNERLEKEFQRFNDEVAKAKLENRAPNLTRPKNLPTIHAYVQVNDDGFTTVGDALVDIDRKVSNLRKRADRITKALKKK